MSIYYDSKVYGKFETSYQILMAIEKIAGDSVLEEGSQAYKLWKAPGKKLKDVLELASGYCNSNHPDLHQEYKEDFEPDDEDPELYWSKATYRRWAYEYIEEINHARSLKKIEDFKNSIYLKKSADELVAILLDPVDEADLKKWDITASDYKQAAANALLTQIDDSNQLLNDIMENYGT